MPSSSRKKRQGLERKAKSTGNCVDCECSSEETSTTTGSSTNKTPIYVLNTESKFYKKYEESKVNLILVIPL